MIFAPTPEDEFLRMQALRALNILDTVRDVRFDSITKFAAQLLEVPISLVSLVDVDRQWFKSIYGLDDEELPRNTSICGHAICAVKADSMFDRIYEVCDTKKDKRFFDNPLVIGEPWIRSYIAYVLLSPSGRNIGTLCVIDTVPRQYTESKKQLLTLLGAMVENLISGQHHLSGVESKFPQ